MPCAWSFFELGTTAIVSGHVVIAIQHLAAAIPALQAYLSCTCQQMSVDHPQIRRCNQCHHLRGVLGQSTETRLHIIERAFDPLAWVFDLGPNLRLGHLDFTLGFVPSTRFVSCS